MIEQYWRTGGGRQECQHNHHKAKTKAWLWIHLYIILWSWRYGNQPWSWEVHLRLAAEGKGLLLSFLCQLIGEGKFQLGTAYKYRFMGNAKGNIHANSLLSRKSGPSLNHHILILGIISKSFIDHVVDKWWRRKGYKEKFIITRLLGIKRGNSYRKIQK